MGAEAAAVRIQFVSGTHAIASALYGCLRPGDELLAVAGRWDTLRLWLSAYQSISAQALVLGLSRLLAAGGIAAWFANPSGPGLTRTRNICCILQPLRHS